MTAAAGAEAPAVCGRGDCCLRTRSLTSEPLGLRAPPVLATRCGPGEPSWSAVASLRVRAVSERLRTWVPAAVGLGESPAAPYGTGTCRRGPSPPTDRSHHPHVLSRVQDSPPTTPQSGSPRHPLSWHAAASALCPWRLTGAGHARCPLTGRGRPHSPPRGCTAPGRSHPASWIRPCSRSLSRRSCRLPVLCIPLPQPCSSSPRVFPFPGKEIARWFFPSLLA